MPMGKITLSAPATHVPRRRKTHKKRTKKNPTRINHTGGQYMQKGSLLNIGPFPKRKTVWMKYAEVNTQTTTTGGVLSQFELNSLFDPRWSVGGHQPLYRDVLADIYDNYKVYKCLVEYTVICRTTNAKYFMGLHIQAGDSAGYPTTPERLIEKPGARWSYKDGSRIGTLRCLYKMSDIFGITDNQYHSIREYGAGKGASPSAAAAAYGAYLTPFVINADETTSTDFTYIISLTFHATWRNLDYEAQN